MLKFIIAILFFVQLHPNRVLFVGDSLTAFQYGWQHKVAKELNAGYDNISKGGKRTDWMLQRLESQLIKNHNYKTCFIYGGANDAYCYVSLDKSVKNVQEMVDLLNTYSIKPIVILGYNPKIVSSRTVYDAATTKRCTDRYAMLQHKLKTELTDCQIVDVDNSLTHAGAPDGIHLNYKAQMRFADYVLNQIRICP